MIDKIKSLQGSVTTQENQFKANYENDFKNNWDQNGDGSIDTNEMVALGWDGDAWNAQVLKHDQDGDGKLNFEESTELWKEYDRDQDGFINADEGNKMLFIDNQFGMGLVESREEFGLVVGGKLENGLEFERYNMKDNDNYTQVNSDGTMYQVTNGELVTWDSNFGNSNIRYQHLEDIQINDLDIVDPDGEKFSKMMEAFNVTGKETIDYGASDPNEYVGNQEVDGNLKASIVEMFLLTYGNDDDFMYRIEENGINITIADDIIGENPYGEEYGIGGFYSPGVDDSGRNTIVARDTSLRGGLLIHEFAHMRDHLVDGQLDGNFNDITLPYQFDLTMEKSRERVENGAAEGLFDKEYSQINELEFIAEMMEGYFRDPILFEERFPEFTEMMDGTFDHLDQTIGLISNS
ncbi:MAG: zinc-dependent peptidase [Candidatus Caenarcaniphilales bacterium]|nr:zinc-dependent peptidase [Candidatus Caenarcaniphilales bacterium]